MVLEQSRGEGQPTCMIEVCSGGGPLFRATRDGPGLYADVLQPTLDPLLVLRGTNSHQGPKKEVLMVPSTNRGHHSEPQTSI